MELGLLFGHVTESSAKGDDRGIGRPFSSTPSVCSAAPPPAPGCRAPPGSSCLQTLQQDSALHRHQHFLGCCGESTLENGLFFTADAPAT